MLFGLSCAVPLVGWVRLVTVNGSPLGSESLASTGTVTAVSTVVDAASFTADGGEFVGVPPMFGAVISKILPSFSLGSAPLSIARSTIHRFICPVPVLAGAMANPETNRSPLTPDAGRPPMRHWAP